MAALAEQPTRSRLDVAVDSIDATLATVTDERDALILWKCRGLIYGYDARWKNAPYVATAVEQLVTSELWNPETGRRSRSFTLAGKLDSTGYSDRRVVIDHKTTSYDITDPNAPYWRQLAIEGQVSHYMLLEWLNGRKVDEALWDVMRKPAISPKALSKGDVKKAFAERTYFGVPLPDEELLALNETGRESLAMYSYRLADDCTSVRPEWYFQRRTVPRVDAELHQYAAELWGHAQEILHARRENRWPRNSGACMLYNSPCKFLGICSGFDSPDSDNWKKKAFVHNELVGVEGDGRDILTNSRIRCFQTCRQKAYLEYELGIERVDDEERESLLFGTYWHRCLETWIKGACV